MTSETPPPNSSRVLRPIYGQLKNLSTNVKGNKELLALFGVVGSVGLGAAYWMVSRHQRRVVFGDTKFALTLEQGQKWKKVDAAFDLAKKDLELAKKDLDSTKREIQVEKESRERDTESAKREIDKTHDLITAKVAQEMLKFGFHADFKKLRGK